MNPSPTGWRTHARRVALVATAIAVAVFLLASLGVDLAAKARASAATNARLLDRLREVALLQPATAAPGTIHVSAGRGDVDDAPVLVWFVPHGRAPVALTAGTPALPRGAGAVRAPTTTVMAGQRFRIAGTPVAGGTLIAATSTRNEDDLLNNLLVVEGVLAPVGLIGVYLAALVVGRSAAGPVERARQRQLAFTADASHELRTPLSVIEAEVGLALSGERTPAAYRAALERVADEGGRLRHIVEDLLFLARFDSHPPASDDGPVDLASVAEVCVNRFAAVARRRHQHLEWSALGWTAERDDGPAVQVSGEWLDRLLGVLVDNACRYTPDGGKIVVLVERYGTDGVLVVDDSGPGIPEDQRDEIFARFHRASPEPGGAGLGLAIASAIVSSSGGRLGVERSPLGGARLRVAWPAIRE